MQNQADDDHLSGHRRPSRIQSLFVPSVRYRTAHSGERESPPARVLAVLVSHPAKTLMMTSSSCADMGCCEGYESETATDSGRNRKSVFEADSSILRSIYLALRDQIL